MGLAAIEPFLHNSHPSYLASSSNYLSRKPLRRVQHESFNKVDEGDESGQGERVHETVPIPLSASDRFSYQAYRMQALATFYESHFGVGADPSPTPAPPVAASADRSFVDLIKRRWLPGLPLGVFTATYNTALCSSMLPKRNTKPSAAAKRDRREPLAADGAASSIETLDSLSLSDARDDAGEQLNRQVRGKRPIPKKSAKKTNTSKKQLKPNGDASFNTMDVEEIRSLLVRPNAHVIVLATQEHGPYVPLGKEWNERASKNRYRWGPWHADKVLRRVQRRHRQESERFGHFSAKALANALVRSAPSDPDGGNERGRGDAPASNDFSDADGDAEEGRREGDHPGAVQVELETALQLAPLSLTATSTAATDTFRIADGHQPEPHTLAASGLSDVSSDDDLYFSAARWATGGVLVKARPPHGLFLQRGRKLSATGRSSLRRGELAPANPVLLRRRLYRYTNLRSAVGEVAALVEDNADVVRQFGSDAIRGQVAASAMCGCSTDTVADDKRRKGVVANTSSPKVPSLVVPPPMRCLPLLRWVSTAASGAAAADLHNTNVTSGRRAHIGIREDALRSQGSFVSITSSQGGSSSSFSAPAVVYKKEDLKRAPTTGTNSSSTVALVPPTAPPPQNESLQLPYPTRRLFEFVDAECRRKAKEFILSNSAEGAVSGSPLSGCMQSDDEIQDLLLSSSSSSSTGGASRCSSCERAVEARVRPEEESAQTTTTDRREMRLKVLGGPNRGRSSAKVDGVAQAKPLTKLLAPYLESAHRGSVFCSVHQQRRADQQDASRRKREAKAHRFNVARGKENQRLEDIHDSILPASSAAYPSLQPTKGSLFHRRWQKEVVLGGCLNNYRGNRQVQRMTFQRVELAAAAAHDADSFMCNTNEQTKHHSKSVAVAMLARHALMTVQHRCVERRSARRAVATSSGRPLDRWEDARTVPDAATSTHYTFPSTLDGGSRSSLLSLRRGARSTVVVPPAPRTGSLLHHYTLVASNSLTSMHVAVYVRTADVLPYVKKSSIAAGGAKGGSVAAPMGISAPLRHAGLGRRLGEDLPDGYFGALRHLVKADSNSHYFPFNEGSNPKMVFREQEDAEESAGLDEAATVVRTGMLGGLVGNKGGVAVEITLDMVRRPEHDAEVYRKAVIMRMQAAEQETAERRSRRRAENALRHRRNESKRIFREQCSQKWGSLISQVRNGHQQHTAPPATSLPTTTPEPPTPSPSRGPEEVRVPLTLARFARRCGGPHSGSDDESTMPSSEFTDSCSSSISSSDTFPSEAPPEESPQPGGMDSPYSAELMLTNGSVMSELFGAHNADFPAPTRVAVPPGDRNTFEEPIDANTSIVVLPLTHHQKVAYRAKRAHLKALERNRADEERDLLTTLIPRYHASHNLVGLAAVGRLTSRWSAELEAAGGTFSTAAVAVDSNSEASVRSASEASPASKGRQAITPLDADFTPFVPPQQEEEATWSPLAQSPSRGRPPRSPSPMSMPAFSALIPRKEILSMHVEALSSRMEAELAAIGDDEPALSGSDTDDGAQPPTTSKPKKDAPSVKLRASELVYKQPAAQRGGLLPALQQQLYEDPVAREERRVWLQLHRQWCYLQFVRRRLRAARLELDRMAGLTPSELAAVQSTLQRCLPATRLEPIVPASVLLSPAELEQQLQEDTVIAFLFSRDTPQLSELKCSSNRTEGPARFVAPSFPFGPEASTGLFQFGTRAAARRMQSSTLSPDRPKRSKPMQPSAEVIRAVRAEDGDDPGAVLLTPPVLSQVNLLPNGTDSFRHQNSVDTQSSKRGISVQRERKERFGATLGDTVSATITAVRRPLGSVLDGSTVGGGRGGVVGFVDASSDTPASPAAPLETEFTAELESSQGVAPFTLPPPEPATELTLLFIGAHLSAHDHHLEKRNHDYWRIVTLLATGTRAATNTGGLGYTSSFIRSRRARRLLERRLRQLHREQQAAMAEGKPEVHAAAYHHARDATEEPDACFFLGDLNYRLRGSNSGLQRLVAQATARPPPSQPAPKRGSSSKRGSTVSGRRGVVSFPDGEGNKGGNHPQRDARAILQNALAVASRNHRPQVSEVDEGAIPVSAEALAEALSDLNVNHTGDTSAIVAELRRGGDMSLGEGEEVLTPEMQAALAHAIEQTWGAGEEPWSDVGSSSSSDSDDRGVVVRAETLAANDQLLLEMSGRAARLVKIRNKLAIARMKAAAERGDDLEAAALDGLHSNPAYNYDQRLVFNGFLEAGKLMFPPSYKCKLHTMSSDGTSTANGDMADPEMASLWRRLVTEFFLGAEIPQRYDGTLDSSKALERPPEVGFARRAMYEFLLTVRDQVTAILTQRDRYTHGHPTIEARSTASMRRGDIELIDELLSDAVFAGLTRVMSEVQHMDAKLNVSSPPISPGLGGSVHLAHAAATIDSFRPMGGGADFMPLSYVRALSELSLWPSGVAEQQAASYTRYVRRRRSSVASQDPHGVPTRTRLRRTSRVLAPLITEEEGSPSSHTPEALEEEPPMAAGSMNSWQSNLSSRMVSYAREEHEHERSYLRVVREVILREAATLVLRLVVEHVRCNSPGYGSSGDGPHPSLTPIHGSLLLSSGTFSEFFKTHPVFKSVPFLCTPHWHTAPMLYDSKRLPSYCDRILVRVNNDLTVREALGGGAVGIVGRARQDRLPSATNPRGTDVEPRALRPDDERPALVVDTIAYTSVPRTSTSDHVPVAAYFVVHAPFYFSPVHRDVYQAVTATCRGVEEGGGMWAPPCSAPASVKHTFRKQNWVAPYLPTTSSPLPAPRQKLNTLFSTLLWVYYRNQVLLAQWEDDQEAYFEAQENALGAVLSDAANRLLRR